MSFILTTNYDVEKYYPHICKQKSQSTEKLNCPDHATRKWQNRGFHRGSLGQSNCRARPPSHYITVSLILQASWKCTTYTESQIWRLSFGSCNCSGDFSGCKEKQPTERFKHPGVTVQDDTSKRSKPGLMGLAAVIGKPQGPQQHISLLPSCSEATRSPFSALLCSKSLLLPAKPLSLFTHRHAQSWKWPF